MQDILARNTVGVTVATGNSFATMKGRLGYVPNAPMILDNGGCISTIDGSYINYHTIENYELDMLEFVLKQKGVEFAYYTRKSNRVISFFCVNEKVASSIKQKYTIRKSQITIDVATFVKDCMKHKVCQIAIKVTTRTQIIMPPVLNYSFSKHVSMYGIQSRGVNKGTGVLKLRQHLGIPIEGVVLAADDYNDIPMFQYVPAPIKIAVSNKSPELCALATHVIETPEQLGPLLKDMFLN